MDNENNLSGCLAYTAVLIVGAIISAIIILVFNIRIPIVIPALVIAAIIGWLELKKRRSNMEDLLGRKIKGDHELVSLSSWMETPTEKRFTNQKVQAKNNQTMPLSLINTSAEIRNSNNILSTIAEEKNQDEEFGESPLGTKIIKFDRQTQIQMRENLTLLLETARTKGRKDLEEETMKMVSSKVESSGNLNKDTPLKIAKLLEPRLYHYLFAHKYLPDKLSESPQMVLSWLAGEKGIEHLKTRWALLPTIYQIETGDYIEPNGINRYVLRPNEDHTLVIIRFPEPIRMTEAYFAAIIFNRKNNSHRYFTLELGFSDQNNNIRKTVLGEWIKDKRINHGDGTLPGIESFSSLIIDRFI